MESTLSKALSICEGNYKHLFDYSKIYSFTTENIDGYINYFDVTNKSLLTVGSSGDQVLNAFFYGCRDITLFDINPFAKYYVYLKMCAIYSLSYEQFQTFFFKHGLETFYNSGMFSREIFTKMQSNLKAIDYDSYYFFEKIFSSFSAKKIRDYLFDDDECRYKVIRGFNAYLKDEIAFLKMKSLIKSFDFRYINGNIFDDNIDGKFDNIFLSNLCTITSIDSLKKLLEKLDINNLKDNGSMLFAYLWDTYFNECRFDDKWKEIYNLQEVKKIFEGFISEYHQIKSAYDILWDEDKKSDLVMIYRKR